MGPHGHRVYTVVTLVDDAVNEPVDENVQPTFAAKLIRRILTVTIEPGEVAGLDAPKLISDRPDKDGGIGVKRSTCKWASCPRLCPLLSLRHALRDLVCNISGCRSP